MTSDLEHRVEDLLKEYLRSKDDPSKVAQLGEDFQHWFLGQYRIDTPRTPPGGKALKTKAEAALWRLSFAPATRPSVDRGIEEAREAWEDFKPHLLELEKMFGAGANIPLERKTPNATYLNLKGLPAKTFNAYVDRLEDIFGKLKGWRRRALGKGLRVALAGPDQFRGTSSGRYNADKDILFVKATPKVMQRAGGTYASPEYILIHELGHRYDQKVGGVSPFGQSQWYTTPYSKTDGVGSLSESFAELFALGHFGIRSYRATDFGSVLDRFEDSMESKRVDRIVEAFQRKRASGDWQTFALLKAASSYFTPDLWRPFKPLYQDLEKTLSGEDVGGVMDRMGTLLSQGIRRVAPDLRMTVILQVLKDLARDPRVKGVASQLLDIVGVTLTRKGRSGLDQLKDKISRAT